MKDLKDRVALVTGGSRGIGAAVAVALAKAGADVAVNYRERADAANAVCGEIKGLGRKSIAVQADVSVSGDVRRMVAEIEAHLGGIDILVNNAGIAHPRTLEEITEAEWDEVLTVNLKSVFLVAEIEAHLGGIDILVNNAGIAHPRTLEEITEAEWDEVLTVNLKSVFLVTQAVVGAMRQRKWGRIINLSSVAAQTGGGGGGHSAR